MLGHGAVGGEATIVDKRAKKSSGDGMVTVYEYVADVVVPGDQPYRCVLREPFIGTNFWSPDVVDTVRVHARVKDRSATFDKDDPRVNTRLRERTGRERFEANSRDVPGTPRNV